MGLDRSRKPHMPVRHVQGQGYRIRRGVRNLPIQRSKSGAATMQGLPAMIIAIEPVCCAVNHCCAFGNAVDNRPCNRPVMCGVIQIIAQVGKAQNEG